MTRQQRLFFNRKTKVEKTEKIEKIDEKSLSYFSEFLSSILFIYIITRIIEAGKNK